MTLRALFVLLLTACAHRPDPCPEPPETFTPPRPMPPPAPDPQPSPPAPSELEAAPGEASSTREAPSSEIEAPIAGHPAPTQLTPISPATCAPPLLEPGSQRWIARRLSTGTMPGPSRLQTFVLDVTGDGATWTEFSQRAAKSNPPDPELPPRTWTCTETGTFTAKVMRPTARELEVLFVLPDTTFVLRCAQVRVQVAPVDGLRKPLRQLTEECKRSGWVTATRLPAEVLRCVDGPDGALTYFGAAPGVEHVTMDEDDCGEPGLALRAIAKDGAVRAVTSKKR